MFVSWSGVRLKNVLKGRALPINGDTQNSTNGTATAKLIDFIFDATSIATEAASRLAM